MTHLGSRRGTGRLLIDGSDACGAAYVIDVYKPRNLMEARGEIAAEEAVLFPAVGAPNVTLRFESGEIVPILITKITGSGLAAMVINGPVPGFGSGT